jgi:hypothetical protein
MDVTIDIKFIVIIMIITRKVEHKYMTSEVAATNSLPLAAICLS